MTDAQKNEIRMLLNEFVGQFPSQARAVAHLKNVSEATVINIRNSKWESISDEMFRNVGKQIGWNTKGAWHIVETLDLNTLITFFADAKDYGNVFALCGSAGCGKTFAAEHFAARHQNTYHMVCAEYWNRKMFLSKLLEKMGKEHGGYNVTEMMDLIIDTLMKQDNPLIILDEADKLSDQVLYFFITLYNMLKGKCGIILMATDFLKKRIMRGVKMNQKGYAEIYSRIGRRFVKLVGTDRKEVQAICEANGITNPLDISEIYNDYDGDLRRVEKMVHTKLVKASRNAA